MANSLKKGIKWRDPINGELTRGTGLGSGSTITFNTIGNNGMGVDLEGKRVHQTRTIRILHELKHSWDMSYGKSDPNLAEDGAPDQGISNSGVPNEEKSLINWENMFRKQLGFLGIFGMGLRKTYTNIVNQPIDIFNPHYKNDYKKSDPRNEE